MNDLERQIARQPLRPIPADWRDEILSRATQAQPSAAAQSDATVPSWQSWLWPSPSAWAALAAIWMVLLGLSAALEQPVPRPSQVFAQAVPVTPFALSASPSMLLAYLADPDSAH